MISTRWIEKRKAYWLRLEQLIAATGQRSVAALSAAQLQELALLYRQTASDLSAVREDATGSQLALYLNQLLGRAHNLIYMGRRPRPKGVWNFYKDEYPAIFRSALPEISLVFAIFVVAALAAFFLGLANPEFPRYLLGGEMIDSIEHHQMWTHSIVTVKPLASSAILTNNLTVSFLTYALGVTAGIGTLWMIILNGLLLGAVGVACWTGGLSLSFWSFVAPHGVLELPAIFIAGGAGLLIARGMLFPGTLPRRESLVQAGARSVRLVLGIIPLLLVAGFIEGFISPSDLPVAVKFLVAAAGFTILALYLFRKGRQPEAVRSGFAPSPLGIDLPPT